MMLLISQTLYHNREKILYGGKDKTKQMKTLQKLFIDIFPEKASLFIKLYVILSVFFRSRHEQYYATISSQIP